jgi:cytidylate kinase
MSNGLIVAIDGPAGSGKSTSAKLVAQKLGYLFIDTGAMYRAITHLAIKNNLLNHEDELIEVTNKCKLELKFIDGQTKVNLNGEDITEEIRSVNVNQHVSEISKIKRIRELLVNMQREMGKTSDGVVMEGRDIATVVFPDADVKVFLTASLSERAKRRVLEYNEKGTDVSLDEIRNNIEKRDKIDSSRDTSPLMQASCAVVIDTTSVTIDEQVNLIIAEAEKAAIKKGINFNQS